MKTITNNKITTLSLAAILAIAVKPQPINGAENSKMDRSGEQSGAASDPKRQQEAYFQRLDGDGNQRITFEEFSTRRPGRKPSPQALKDLFAQLDANKNGYCTPAEFIRARLSATTRSGSKK